MLQQPHFRLSTPAARLDGAQRSQGTSSDTLKSLLSQTRKLQSAAATSPADGDHDILPRVQLGLDQIESQSRRLRSRASRVDGLDASTGLDDRPGLGAHYLLAGGGINAEELGRTINAVDLKGTFEPLQPLHDADVEGFLRHEHEQSIISSIEEGRRQTVQQFYDRLDQTLRQDWARQKETLFEELRRAPSEAVGAARSRDRHRLGLQGSADSALRTSDLGGSLDMHSRMMRYETAVASINAARRDRLPYGVVSALAEACAAVASDSRTQGLSDTWRLLRHLVGEREGSNGIERQRTLPRQRAFAKAYLGPRISPDAVALRQSLVTASLAHLEEQFFAHVSKQIEANPTDAHLGGDPSVDNKIRAYVLLKFGTGVSPEKKLEIINKTPMWARLFYLVRSGFAQEALVLAQRNETHIRRVDPSFVVHFATWVESPERRLSQTQRDHFVADYNQRLRQDGINDPFKAALCKIIGRIDLQRKTAPLAVASVEDWAWLQLVLTVEGEAPEDVGRASSSLSAFAAVVSKYGEGHFDPNGTRPLTFFRMLLMSGQFEKAVLYLEQKSLFQVDALHFSVALAYYGLLRVSDGTTAGTEAASAPGKSANAGPAVDFARQIQRYVRLFSRSSPEAALQYIFLVCLNADAPAPVGPKQIEVCHQMLSNLVMEAREYTALLGSIHTDGTRTEGMLQRNLSLIHLDDNRDFLSKIVKRAADSAQQEKRFHDAVVLYHLAGEFEQVVAALNVQLGAALSQATEEGPAAADLSGSLRDPVNHARAILAYYDQQPGASRLVSSARRTTCELLLRLDEIFRLSRARQPAQAAELLENVSFLPQGSDLVEIIRRADETKALDDAILRNLDFIVLETMAILHRVFLDLKDSPYGDSARQARMAAIQARARALTTFAGMLRYRLTPETYAELSRLHVYMH